jgi:hypothetical protein
MAAIKKPPPNLPHKGSLKECADIDYYRFTPI